MDERRTSRRAIKNPKRFDDEAYTPAYTHKNKEEKEKKQQEEQAKPSPEPTFKNIIKVKLNKAGPKATTTPKAAATTPKISLPSTPKHQTTAAATAAAPPPPPTPPVESDRVAPAATKPPKQAPKQQEEALVVAQSPLPLPPPAKVPKVVVSEALVVRRPKTERPRISPTYNDLIPNVVLPFWDARTAAEEHEDDNVKELVHCHCAITEEVGLMVQCETCLTWQHAHCLGIESAENAPENYTCLACLNPRFARESMRWAYDQDWLTKGRLKKFPCDPEPIPEKEVNALCKINQMIGNVLHIHKIIHSLRVKQRILMNAADDDPELKLFRNQWPANYQHRDGTPFISSIPRDQSRSPASTISAIADTPDLNEITVETVVDGTLPDIGHLEDVSAILESSGAYSNNIDQHLDQQTLDQALSQQPNQQPSEAAQPTSALATTTPAMANNADVTPKECRSNLRLHIRQTEEFLGIELEQIEKELDSLEKELPSDGLEWSISSLKNDLLTMKKYTSLVCKQ